MDYKHPFRFVFIDGCAAAVDTIWPSAFGISDKELTYEDLQNHPERAQAFLGFTGEIYAPNRFDWYGYTLSEFFDMWMKGTPLKKCVELTSNQHLLYGAIVAIFGNVIEESEVCEIGRSVEPGAHWRVYGYPYITRDESLYATPAYQQAALRLIVEEANRVARELRLSEGLPITESKLVRSYISPPGMSQRSGTFGNITTSNYTYYVSVGNKFSFLTKQHLQADYPKLREQYWWPISRLDTNAALQIATNLLIAVSIDVQALNRDCDVKIRAYTPEGKGADHFVPVYWIAWVPRHADPAGGGAAVEILEPTKEIRQLHVLTPEYIRRTPLAVTNLEFLLENATNASGLASPSKGE